MTRRPPVIVAGLAFLTLVGLGLPALGAGTARTECRDICAFGSAAHDHVTVVKGTHKYTTKVAEVPVVDGPDGDHHAVIDTRLYLPDNATPAHPQPAILMTHGFGLSKDSAEVTATADFLARHGYIVLTWTSQGFGQSSGCIRLDSFAYDVKDARQLVDKLLVPRADVLRDRHGLVLGMTGGSYGGGITWNVAAMDHRIRAIVPGRTWNSLLFSLDPNNYIPPGDVTGFDRTLQTQGVFKAEWTSLFFAAGNAAPIGGLPPSGDEEGGCVEEHTSGAGTLPETICPGYPLSVCQTYADSAATGDASSATRRLLAGSSVAYRLHRLKAATLIYQGQSDTLFNENEAAAAYVQLRRHHVPVAMTWNYGGHGGYGSRPGECDVYGGGDRGLDSCYLTLRMLRWFDHYLRGKPLGQFPRFTYYRDWVPYAGHGPDDEQYGVASFPTGTAFHFRLSGTSALVRSHVVPGNVSFVNPLGGTPASYTETSNFSAPGDSPDLSSRQPSDPPGEAVSFTSAPFDSDVVSVGVPSAHLNLGHANGQDLVLFAKVFDVAPDGSSTLIKRLVAPVRVPASHANGAVDIKLLGFAHLFRRGHRVRLTLASTDQAYFGSRTPDVVTVSTGPKNPSTFTLPYETGGILIVD